MLFKYSIKKIYKEFNITILIFFLCLILLPIIVYSIKKYFPNIYEIFRCPYYIKNRVPCPFCGITTDFKNILMGNIFSYKYNLLSMPLIFISVIESSLRIMLIIYNERIKSFKIIVIDFIFHINLCLLLIIYIIVFFQFGLERF